MTNTASSGYQAQFTGRVPIFNGLEGDYKMWMYRFVCFEKSTRYPEYKVIEYNDGLAKGGDDVVPKPVDYDKRNKELFFSLIEATDDASAQLIITEAEEDGAKAMKVLETHNMGSIATQKVTCLTKMMETSLQEDETLTSYAARLVEIKKRLTQMKVPIDEDIFTVLGLRGLPDKYDLFVQVVRRRKPWATFDEFITMLKEEDSPLFAKKSDSILKVGNF